MTLWLAAATLGLIFGSFISMLSWRLPRIQDLESAQQFEKISLGGSKCPHCDAGLPWYRLIPVVSWALSLGRCHHCHQSISPRYPLIEISSMLLVFLALYQFGFTINALIASGFFLWLLTITVIDLEHQLILDNLSIPLIWLGLIVNTYGVFESAENAILGAVFGYLSLWTVYQLHKWITKKHGMGFGDFKLLAALGAWLGVYALPQIIMLAASSGVLVALLLMLAGKHQWQSKIAFGPFLAAAGVVTMIMGNEWLVTSFLSF